MSVEKHVWAIVYINNTYRETLESDAKRCGIKDIKFIIPTISIIRKQFRGKKFTEEVPLLFNYGFIRIPIQVARSKDDLLGLKRSIQGIYNWLWLNQKSFSDKKTVKVATTSFREILRIVNISRRYSVYAESDIRNMKAGAMITLRGYPFDGIEAEIISVNIKKEEVDVNLNLGMMGRKVTVSFSNIMYSIYGDFEEITPTDNTLEGMKFYAKHGIDLKDLENES